MKIPFNAEQRSKTSIGIKVSYVKYGKSFKLRKILQYINEASEDHKNCTLT
jgi:hypothetical protein